MAGRIKLRLMMMLCRQGDHLQCLEAGIAGIRLLHEGAIDQKCGFFACGVAGDGLAEVDKRRRAYFAEFWLGSHGV